MWAVVSSCEAGNQLVADASCFQLSRFHWFATRPSARARDFVGISRSCTLRLGGRNLFSLEVADIPLHHISSALAEQQSRITKHKQITLTSTTPSSTNTHPLRFSIPILVLCSTSEDAAQLTQLTRTAFALRCRCCSIAEVVGEGCFGCHEERCDWVAL